jgi:hypothetical protein
VNAALTYIAGQKEADVLVAAASPGLAALFKGWGLPQAADMTGKTELDAYMLRGSAAFSGKVVSFQLAAQFRNLASYAIFARAPTVEYACTGLGPATYKACMKSYPRGGPAAELVVVG